MINFSNYPFFTIEETERDWKGRREGAHSPMTIKKLIRNERVTGWGIEIKGQAVWEDSQTRPTPVRGLAFCHWPPLTPREMPSFTQTKIKQRLFLFRSKNDRDAFARSTRPSSEHTASRFCLLFLFFLLPFFSPAVSLSRERERFLSRDSKHAVKSFRR